MNKLTLKQKIKLVKKYRNTEKIKVVDFESAQLRCEQRLAEIIIKYEKTRDQKRREYLRYCCFEYNASDRKFAYNYEYLGKILRNEINIQSGKKQKEFIAKMRNKYGSVRAYHFLRSLERQ